MSDEVEDPFPRGLHLRKYTNVQTTHSMRPQTKIWENGTNRRGRIFKALFTYVSTRFGLGFFEKCFENAFPNVCSVFQHLRLGCIHSDGNVGGDFRQWRVAFKNAHDLRPPGICAFRISWYFTPPRVDSRRVGLTANHSRNDANHQYRIVQQHGKCSIITVHYGEWIRHRTVVLHHAMRHNPQRHSNAQYTPQSPPC